MIAPENLKESLDLCERENAKARKIILWCAKRLPIAQRRILIKKVKSDIMIDHEEDDREALLKLLRATTKLTDCIQEGVDADANPAPQWWAKLDALAGQVRGLQQELGLEPTLHELREDLLK